MMASSEFDVEYFEKRLHGLKDSQESIQGLSAWCLERRQHHKKIVATWLQVLKKVKVEHRLTLFYLANDVIQYSKRKNFEFVESWGTTLQRATTMVRDEKVKHRILRIFKIWDQRQVYDEEFLTDLSGLISAAPKKKPEPPPSTAAPEEFQASLLISTMRSCANLEQATDARLRDLRESSIDVDNAEELLASLKDRRHVEDAEKEVDTVVRNMENYVKALEAEIVERTQVLELLEQADQFYETQRGEVKIVTNAYRNFGSRVKNLKKKLDELLPTLISPIPSPDVNAPSPSPDSDIELPGDDGQLAIQTADSMMLNVVPPSMYNSYGQDYDPIPVPAPDHSGNSSGDFTNNFSSFMGGNVDFDMRNIFNDKSDTSTNGSQKYNNASEAMPIEVINLRPSKANANAEDFSISSFLKNVLPTGGIQSVGIPSGGIPGLDSVDPGADSPQISEYGHLSSQMGTATPVSGRMISGAPGTPISNHNNHQILHSTPLRRSLADDSHTPSPYSSQNSQSNILPFVDNTIIASPVNPLPPPPLPPPIFLDEENCYNKLPPKFPTWTSANEGTKNENTKWEEKVFPGKNSSIIPNWSEDSSDKNKSQQWVETVEERWEGGNESGWTSGITGKTDVLSETPESPPMYEKSSFNTPIEYNDVDAQPPILSSESDVDHRVRTIPMPSEMHQAHRLVKAADVDHRNLISLTGSPANNASNSNEAATPVPNNTAWAPEDQNYRRQQGDIVESVDMEMSDEEGDGKPKSRVLVQLPPPSHRQDLDMRMIPLPANPLQRPLLQDIRPPPPPPPPPPQQFHRNPNDFHNPGDFRQDFPPGLRQNSQQVFVASQPQDFHGVPGQDFHQNQPEFHREFHDFHENSLQHPRITGMPEFLTDSPLRGRYPEPHMHHQQQQQQQQQQHHRDSPMFHRNDRGMPRGRGGFPRSRGRGRFDDLPNNRRSHLQQHGEGREGNLSRGPLLPPPDTCVILDDEGRPITRPDLDAPPLPGEIPKMLHPDPAGLQNSSQNDIGDNSRLEMRADVDLRISGGNSVIIPGICADSEEAGSEERSQEGSVPRGDEPPRQLSEHLEALMNSGKTTGVNDLKRQAANGSFAEQEDAALASPGKKRTLLPNEPLLQAPSGGEIHPVIVYEYDGNNPMPVNFRPRMPGIGGIGDVGGGAPGAQFPVWRGAPGHPMRPRGPFRGGPRSPWGERGRGPGAAGFGPRGNKRGAPFRGAGGFRGRGRGSPGW